MNLRSIMKLWRARLFDEKGSDSKKLWKDWEGVEYANEAEREIARRLYVLNARDLIGSIKLSGTAGQIDSLAVSGVTITNGTTVFSSSLTATAAALAANINAYTSTPNYRASSRGPHVLIKAVPGTGWPAAGYALTPVVSGGLTAVSSVFTGLCRQVVAVDQRYLPVHEKVIKITRFKPSAQDKPIAGCTREELDANIPGWETEVAGTIRTWAPDYDNSEVIVYPPPAVAELIETDCYCLPLVDMTEDDMDALPEIPEKYHLAMVDSMISQAFLKNDVEETQDLPRAARFEQRFEAKIEAWRVEQIRNTPSSGTNRMPAGLL